MKKEKQLTRKISFSRKNADLYEHLNKLDDADVNVAGYICDLIRKDMSGESDVDFKLLMGEVQKINHKLDNLKVVQAQEINKPVVKASATEADDGLDFI